MTRWFSDYSQEELLQHFLRKHGFTKEAVAAALARGVTLFGPDSLRKYLAKRDFLYFIMAYFGKEFTVPLADVHYRMLEHMEDVSHRAVSKQQGVNVALAIPRGLAKSTYFSRILPLHGMLYGWSKITVLIGNNTGAAARLIDNIRRVVEMNDILREDFPNVEGDVWGAEHIKATNGCEIWSFGAGSGGIRGVASPTSRPSLVIGDDLDDDKSVRSEVETQANCDWWDQSVMQLGDNITKRTSFVVVGTIIKRRSLLTHILGKAEFATTIERGVIKFSTNQDLWDEWLIEFNRNKPRNAGEDMFYQEHKEAMLEGTEVLWPELPDSYYTMMRVRASSKKAFASEIQNAPIADGESRFGELAYFSVSHDGMLIPSTRAKEMFGWLDPVPLKECQLHAAVDPTTKGGLRNDYSALVEVLYHKKSETFYVWYAQVQKRDYLKLIHDLIKRIEYVREKGYRYNGFYFEENAAGSVVRDLLTQKVTEAKIPIRILPIRSYSNKLERIEAMSEDTSNGRILFHDNVDPTLIMQIENFPFENDDGPDALEMVVRSVRERESRAWFGAV